MNTVPITAPTFFNAWKRACEGRKEALLEAWPRAKPYTAQIFHVEDAVIKGVAEELELDVYSGYYSVDAIFIRKGKGDRVHCAPSNQNWFHNIRIAFEHENSFRSGLFQEVSHLLITRADLRVLVTYPEGYDLAAELKNLEQIIKESDLGTADPAFLFIAGKRIESNTGIEWCAYTYQQGNLEPMKP